MLDLFYDRRTGNLTTLTWTLVGVVLLGMGLFTFKESVQAWLGGQQYAGGLSYRRQMSNLVSADIGAIISLFLVIAGATTIFAGLCQTYPALERQRWFRRIAASVFGTLLLLLLLLGVLVVADRLF